MDQDNISTVEVIQALQEVGLSDDIIAYLVPILAYESRENGVPYVLTSKDELSDSYGLGQVNVKSMESAIWMALTEAGIEIPGSTEQQKSQWNRAGYDESEKDVRDFTEEQEKFVIDKLNNGDLKLHAAIVKHMIHQKQLENKGMSEMDAIADLYVLTPKKFDVNNTDFTQFPEESAIEAQEFKTGIDAEVEKYYDKVSTDSGQAVTPRPIYSTKEEKQMYETQVGPAVEQNQSYEKAQLKTDIARGNVPSEMQYKSMSEYQMMKMLHDNVNAKRKKLNIDLLPDMQPMKKAPEIKAAPQMQSTIKFPYGRPVTIQEVLDLLEP